MGCFESTARKADAKQLGDEHTPNHNHTKYHQGDLQCMARQAPTKDTIITCADDNVYKNNHIIFHRLSFCTIGCLEKLFTVGKVHIART